MCIVKLIVIYFCVLNGVFGSKENQYETSTVIREIPDKIHENPFNNFVDKEEEKFSHTRKNRQYRSVRNSKLFSLFKQNPADNYRPVDATDPFDFLRDHYPLPKGKIFVKLHKKIYEVKLIICMYM